MQEEEEEEGEERRGGTIKKQNLHQGVRNKFDFGVPSPQGMVMPIVMMIPKMIKMRIVDGG